MDAPNFRSTNLVPPQNIEVEEAILGGILLDPEGISRVSDKLIPEAFYTPVHVDIYKAALALHGEGKPTDLIAMTDWLTDQNQLKKIGGQAKLIQLLDRTVSAVNIDSLAVLVMDKYIRRELIKAGTEVTQLGYAADRPLEIVLDESEQQILNLTQSRPKIGLTPIKEIVATTYQDIQDRHDQLIPPGLTSDFSDLDGMTSGFQRSDLIIIAGRPSMGKCLAYDAEIVLADGSIQTIEQLYHQQQADILTLNNNWKFSWTKPSVYVDDGIKPVFRMRTRLGRSIETTLIHPFLTLDGWRSLSQLQVGDKIAVPRIIPVFGGEFIPEYKVKLLGYLIGDGCLTQNRISFTNINPIIQEDFIAAVQEFGNLKVRVDTSNGTGATSLFVTANLAQSQINIQGFGIKLKQILKKSTNFSGSQIAQQIGVSPSLLSQWQKGVCAPSKEVLERLCNLLNLDPSELIKPDLDISSENSLLYWLRSIGLAECTSHHKFVPDFIFTLQKPLVSSFLNRLFATDGWASVLSSGQAQLGFATVSEKLARQVQHLLLRFGIITQLKYRSIKYKEERKSAWQLDITDARSIHIFITEIGIFGKEEAIEKVRSVLSTKKYQTNRDLIPLSVWAKLNIARESESWQSLATRAGIADSSNIHVGKRAPTRDKLLQLATAVESQDLQDLATSQIYWDEIVEIEFTGNKQVYDLTIPDTHNFVANDICVHNTAISLNIAYNMAKLHQLPVLVFSLEMSKDQLVQRLIASEAGVDSSRLRAGRISQNEWDPILKAVDRISELPIFIDDNASMTMMEMRSQARKLQAQNGGKLGLIMIDYLQLMEGGGDNRVQEISKITRSLKGLARELQVPLIALSQLSRSVEARNNKRPMMSDLRESGCLTGDTLITMADTGIQIPIRDLVGKSQFGVWALDETNMQLRRALVSHAFATGLKPVWQVKTQSGRIIRATANHQFLTINGWKRLEELSIDDRLAVTRKIPYPTLEQSKIAVITRSLEIQKLANSDVYWDKIVAIDPDGESDVYDLTVPHFHNFVANNIIAHNSIEQDADLIIMLYRDAYYNPDTPDRDITELIITKHRNGPTGVVKLVFDPALTKFKNLARQMH
jgi:replicative DNA helicase